MAGERTVDEACLSVMSDEGRNWGWVVKGIYEGQACQELRRYVGQSKFSTRATPKALQGPSLNWNARRGKTLSGDWPLSICLALPPALRLATAAASSCDCGTAHSQMQQQSLWQFHCESEFNLQIGRASCRER